MANDLYAAHPDELDILGTLCHRIGDGDFFFGIQPEPGTVDIQEACNGFFDDIASGFSSAVSSVAHAAGSALKAIAHSPITKVVAGATALVMPAVGVPLAAGLTIADRAIQVSDGLRPTTPAKQQRIRAAVTHTLHLAKQKDARGQPVHPDAVRFVEFLHMAQNLRKAQEKKYGVHARKLVAVHSAHPAHHQPGTLLVRDPKTHKLTIVKHSRGFVPA